MFYFKLTMNAKIIEIKLCQITTQEQKYSLIQKLQRLKRG